MTATIKHSTPNFKETDLVELRCEFCSLVNDTPRNVLSRERNQLSIIIEGV